MTAIGFISGSTVEVYKKSVFKIENDSLKQVIKINKETVDWNALKNIRISEITDNCTRCNPQVINEVLYLDERRLESGRLVGK